MNDSAPLKDPSLSATIYSELKKRLMLGTYLPGDRLSMRKLASEFGTSPMPVREALKRLTSEHAIESEAAKAYRVPLLSDKRAADLFELRALLESAAIKAAFPVLPATLPQLSALRDRMEAHLRLGDFPAYMADNHRFHFLIYAQADNPDMVFMIEQLWMQTGPSLHNGLQRSGSEVLAWNTEHSSIIDAIERGASEDVSRIMCADVEWGANFYRA